MLIFILALFTLILILAQDFLRRSGPWLAVVLFALVPALLTPYWFRINQDIGWFPWAKLYTILLSVLWITLLRFSRVGRIDWACFGVILLLIVNVAEAMTQDFFGGHLAHYLVLGSGLLLLATLPHPRYAIVVDPAGGHRDLLYLGLTRCWVLEYTLWNAAFVYLNYPVLTGQQLAVLVAALLVGLFDPARWLQARAYTLAVSLLLLPTFPGFFLTRLDSSEWANPHRENLVAALCLVVIAANSMRLAVRHGRPWAGQDR